MTKLEQAARQIVEDWNNGYPLNGAINMIEEALTTQDHIRDATKMVKCICGDIYPADSFGAGFIAATGRCQNCCAAEQAEQEPVAWRYETSQGVYRYRGYVPNFDVEYKNLKPIPLYAAPVRTKDLTDDEIEAIEDQFDSGYHSGYNELSSNLGFAHAVIAADREKNK